jgi:hypothetical protein
MNYITMAHIFYAALGVLSCLAWDWAHASWCKRLGLACGRALTRQALTYGLRRRWWGLESDWHLRHRVRMAMLESVERRLHAIALAPVLRSYRCRCILDDLKERDG